ncbi:MAG TPA: hypothetical protein VGR91_07350 [Stellaceae bacterium]|nr:hypothetical protein [Stellaceae bacterium]
MKARVSIGLVVALAVAADAGAAAAGGCVPTRQQPCPPPDRVVNFNLVPDVGRAVVLDEPAAALAPPPPPPLPEAAPYTGPMLGVNKNERAPTIGYYWSLN